MEYRIKFDNEYVKECDREFLVKCKEYDSIFSEDTAKAILKQCPVRVKIYKIITHESMVQDL